MILDFVYAFLVGGAICLVGQILINKTHMTSARILVIFLVLGGILELAGVFDTIKDFAGAGISVPITGFGSNMVKGAREGVQKDGFLGALTGGLTAASGVLAVSVIAGLIFALVSKAKTKRG